VGAALARQFACSTPSPACDCCVMNTKSRVAAVASGKVDAALFDKTIKPLDMVGHGLAGT
jgi:hypothetical protein